MISNPQYWSDAWGRKYEFVCRKPKGCDAECLRVARRRVGGSRMSRFRLPWKRGPAAWRIARDAEAISRRLAEERRSYFSGRCCAKMLGVSTQPVRDWIQRGYLQAEGPRHQVSRPEMQRFVAWLAARAEPFEPQMYARRFFRRDRMTVRPFAKLAAARFAWPTRAPPWPALCFRADERIAANEDIATPAMPCGPLRRRQKVMRHW